MKVAWMAAASVAAAAFAAHVPMLMGKGGGCPFGYGRAGQVVLTTNEARPMLGFVLGRTTRAEVRGCEERRGELECVRGARTLWLRFAQDGRLAQIRSALRERDRAPVQAAFVEAQQRLHAQARGDLGLAQVLQQASFEASAAGLRATVRATNMGDGFLLTEDYRAL